MFVLGIIHKYQLYHVANLAPYTLEYHDSFERLTSLNKDLKMYTSSTHASLYHNMHEIAINISPEFREK